ncbi:MAG: PPC domain-containing DNA-binding protein [Acidobacteriaceae bacterium]
MKLPEFLYVGSSAVLACAFVASPPSAIASRNVASQAVPSSSTSVKDQAPLMKFKILDQSAQQTTYAVIFGSGDEVFSGLTQFAEKNHIVAARITGIGAVRNATLAWFDPQRKTYRRISIDHQSEVLSLLGDIAMYQGKPVVHVHMVVGFPFGMARGGHLLQAHVQPTLEVIVTAYSRPLYKKFDPEKGLAVIDPSVHK